MHTADSSNDAMKQSSKREDVWRPIGAALVLHARTGSARHACDAPPPPVTLEDSIRGVDTTGAVAASRTPTTCPQ